MINETIPFQTAIPVKKIKEELQSIYNQLGMSEKTAKATDLKD
jgi:hypothetical protein